MSQKILNVKIIYNISNDEVTDILKRKKIDKYSLHYFNPFGFSRKVIEQEFLDFFNLEINQCNNIFIIFKNLFFGNRVKLILQILNNRKISFKEIKL
ncbi:hypothetical protein VI34_06460 [Methylophilales bacterium MBRSG12]|uniref:Uncharacterized protein n=1 Tax=Methylophilales bacterium MBRS-H7 TaxID=1623450 RepID=A0A0H4J3J7_9PROT|nr:hypothetical protein UZ34_03865 [Methylophilales bacterium MBRSF5]AKO66303.1 hypothetical protein VI33_06470 [Methylophilales bacterium MBRS-H7]AKO67619.1 hypothetical protein VI34_06460 [Methylophilales bacterium MBRSG12]